MIKIRTHTNYVDLAVGKLDHPLVERARDYLDEKGNFIIGEGNEELNGFPKKVIAGKSDYSVFSDIYYLSDINGVLVLKQYWQKRNPEKITTLSCSIHGINKTLNGLFLENLVINVVDSNKEKELILNKLKEQL